jgi:D-alanyl-lipoteichoic acid acyltransferase DltB (MBOAT superfamily)
LNYSDFSFWWVLFLFSVPFFTIRYLAKSFNLWLDILDGIGLAVMSLMLFSNASFSSFAIFLFEVVFNYLMVFFVLNLEGWRVKFAVLFIVAFDLFILAYFKYLTFLVEAFLGLSSGEVTLNWQQSFPLPVFKTIPPGLSFYTFEMVAFVVDSFNSKRKKPIEPLDYLNFMVFFPKIVAGPIERKANLLPQLQSFRFKFTQENFDEALRWFSLGAFMKFVLADNISPYIDLKETANAWFIWFEAFLFNLRIYFDFAGYSFIALALARMMGIKLTVNFLAPFTSQSINEFWQRWHITLSTWFRDYVFIPLMGSQKHLAPLYLFLTFTLSGFWHGAAWNFIIWGAYHGALLLVLRYLGRPFHKWVGKYMAQPQFVSWGLTFVAVIFGCLFFMETNQQRLAIKLLTLISPGAYSLNNLGGVFSSFSFNEIAVLIVLLALSTFVLIMEHLAVAKQKFEYELLLSPTISKILLVLTILLAANQPSKFIYFDF